MPRFPVFLLLTFSACALSPPAERPMATLLERAPGPECVEGPEYLLDSPPFSGTPFEAQRKRLRARAHEDGYTHVIITGESKTHMLKTRVEGKAYRCKEATEAAEASPSPSSEPSPAPSPEPATP